MKCRKSYWLKIFILLYLSMRLKVCPTWCVWRDASNSCVHDWLLSPLDASLGGPRQRLLCKLHRSLSLVSFLLCLYVRDLMCGIWMSLLTESNPQQFEDPWTVRRVQTADKLRARSNYFMAVLKHRGSEPSGSQWRAIVNYLTTSS